MLLIILNSREHSVACGYAHPIAIPILKIEF